MKRPFKNIPYRNRPLTASERSIRTKYAGMFILACIGFLSMMVISGNKDSKISELKETTDSLRTSLNDCWNDQHYSDSMRMEFAEVDQMNTRWDIALEYYRSDEAVADAEKNFGYKTVYNKKQRNNIADNILKFRENYVDLYTTMEVYRVKHPKEVEEIEGFMRNTE
jgi:hypothetical protein